MFATIYSAIEPVARVALEALANGIWQAALLALALTLALRIAPPVSARVRFGLWGAALVVALALPALSTQVRVLSLNSPEIAQTDPGAGSVTDAQPAHNAATTAKKTATKNTSTHSRNHTTVTPTAEANDSPARATALGAAQRGAALQKTHATRKPANARTQQPLTTASLKPAAATTAPSALTWRIDLPNWALWSALALWGLGAALLLVRLLLSYFSLLRLKNTATDLPQHLQRQLGNIAHTMGLTRPVRFLAAENITMPLALGLGQAAVIYPARLLDDLTHDEIEHIAVHELAHLKRGDDWSCLFQRLAQALFFFNPAVALISRKLDLERELACDEMVVAHGAHARGYASSLTRLVEMTRAPRHAALAAGAFLTGARLSVRVERLIRGALVFSPRATRAVIVAGLTVILGLAAQFTIAPTVVAFDRPPQVTHAAPAPLRPVHTSIPAVAPLHAAPAPATAVAVAADDESSESMARAEYLKRLSRMIEDYTREYNSSRSAANKERQRELKARITELQERLAELNYGSSSTELLFAPGSGYAYSIATAPTPAIGARPHVSRLPGVPRATVRSHSPDDADYILRNEDGSGVAVYNSTTEDGPIVYSFRSGETPQLKTVTLGESGYGYIYSDDEDDAPIVVHGGSSVTGIGNLYGMFNFGDGETHYSWRDGGRRFTIRARGEVTFTADDSDVESVSEDGFIVIQERGRGMDHEYEVYAYEDGELDRTYYVDGRRHDIDDDAREWIADAVLRAVRNTGIGAEARVAKILEKGGVDAVLREIEDIESSHSQRMYYAALIESDHSLAGADLARVIDHLSREIDSDFERAEFFSRIDEDLLRDEAVLRAYVDAVEYIDSDFEKRRALSPVLSQRDLPAATLVQLLKVAERFDSDFERAELLSEISGRGLNDAEVIDAYVRAVVDIGSDFEKRRVLSRITDVNELSEATLLTALQIAESISSDFERAELLIDLYPHASANDKLLAAYVQAIEDIDSNFEKRRVLDALTDRRTLTPEVTLTVLEMAQTISSDFERAELLLNMSRYCSADQRCWAAYVDAVADLSSDFEKSRVLEEMAYDDSDEQTLLTVLRITEDMSSDFEKAKVLRELMKVCIGNDNLRDAYLDAVDSIDSDYERNNLLARIYKLERRDRREGR